MNAPRVAFYTLGCKLNQFETESIADSFREAGFELEPLDQPSDIVVVNTCTVTSKAEQKARRMIRKLLKDFPGLRIIVTGCYAELEAEELSKLDGRVLVIPGSRKSELIARARILAESIGAKDGFRSAFSVQGAPDDFAFDSAKFTFHSRASLKIQDGCDNECSYCRVRLARGRSRSLEPERILKRLLALEAGGYRETTLTGVNISMYLSGGLGFSGLLLRLLEATEDMRFRISSFEPDRIDEVFAEAVSHPRVRPHFHIPLQSGSPAILRSMRRSYAPLCLYEACERLRKAKTDPFFAADIIVGFPGETEDDFLATRKLCEDLDFAWLHVFPFSPRPGTEAASLRPHVPERIAVERLAELGALAERGKAAYVERWMGQTVEAIVESRFEDGSGDHHATTENYIKVRVGGLDPEKTPRGTCLRCRISGKGEDGFDALALRA